MLNAVMVNLGTGGAKLAGIGEKFLVFGRFPARKIGLNINAVVILTIHPFGVCIFVELNQYVMRYFARAAQYGPQPSRKSAPRMRQKHSQNAWNRPLAAQK
jgi:hypothetical protein